MKDLSRFGRNYIEVGNYLEQVFPFLGVRFISVNDDYDSKDPHSIGDIASVFKTLYYDFYSKDLSEKVKSTKRTKAQRGEYINAFAPYGLVKCKENHNKLEVDNEAANVVKYIFDSFVGGKGKTEIAKELNANNVPTPMVYKEQSQNISLWSDRFSSAKIIWTDNTINWILQDERYIGSVVYGKRSVIAVGSDLQRINDKKDWIVKKEMHDPIISKEVFEQAQSMIKDVPVYNNTSKKGPINRKIKCGHCGHILLLGNSKNPVFRCETSRFTDKFDCKNAIISKEKLYDVMLKSLQNQALILADMKKIMLLKKQKDERKIRLKSEEILRAEKELSHLKLQSRKLFEKMLQGKIDKVFYSKESKIFSKRQDTLSIYIETLKAELKILGDTENSILNHFGHVGEVTEITDEIVDKLIFDVLVLNDSQIIMRFKFQDELDQMGKVLKSK